jgi:hypothetical protein
VAAFNWQHIIGLNVWANVSWPDLHCFLRDATYFLNLYPSSCISLVVPARNTPWFRTYVNTDPESVRQRRKPWHIAAILRGDGTQCMFWRLRHPSATPTAVCPAPGRTFLVIRGGLAPRSAALRFTLPSSA